jgi:hypothetical protein
VPVVVDDMQPALEITAELGLRLNFHYQHAFPRRPKRVRAPFCSIWPLRSFGRFGQSPATWADQKSPATNFGGKLMARVCGRHCRYQAAARLSVAFGLAEPALRYPLI